MQHFLDVAIVRITQAFVALYALAHLACAYQMVVQ
jgi:hypothetical protein